MRPATGLALLLILAASPARASDSDLQFWTTATASAPLSKRLTGTIEASQRFRGAEAGRDQLQLRGNLDLALDKTVSLGGGLTYSDSGAIHEVRPHQQVSLTFGNVSLRTRLEERFIEGSGVTGLRLREKLQLRLPVDKQDRLALWAEPFFVLQPATTGKPTGLEQLRLGITDEHRLSRHLGLSFGYLLIITPHRAAATHFAHVPLLTLAWKG